MGSEDEVARIGCQGKNGCVIKEFRKRVTNRKGGK